MNILNRFMELTREFDTHDAFQELYNEIYRLDPDDFDQALSDFTDFYTEHLKSRQGTSIEASSPELNEFLAGFEVS